MPESLYNQYRPKKFSDFVGNDAVIKAISGKIKSGKIPSVILLQGPYGCGKTSLARVIASSIKTDKWDTIEYDSSVIGNIADIRNIVAASKIKPQKSEYKVYIIDEIHTASKEAKDGLLKWCEDTPSHVIIILCTTEPFKMNKGVVTRCLEYKMSPLEPEQIKEVLSRVVTKEKLSITDKVLNRISKISDGSPRLAISKLESVIGLSESEALLVVDLPEESESGTLYDLFKIMMNDGKWEEYTKIIKSLTEQPESIRRAALGYFNAVLLNQSEKKLGFAKLIAGIVEILEPNWFDGGKASLTRCCFEIHLMHLSK